MNYEVKVFGTRNGEDGQGKHVKDLYLVEATSLTDSIMRTYEAVDGCYEEFRPIVAKEVAYSAVLTDAQSEDRFYKAKVNTMQIDERTGKEIKNPLYLIIQANDLDSAKHRLEDERKQWLVDSEVEAISETKYYEYIS
jgi:hypothetical protein